MNKKTILLISSRARGCARETNTVLCDTKFRWFKTLGCSIRSSIWTALSPFAAKDACRMMLHCTTWRREGPCFFSCSRICTRCRLQCKGWLLCPSETLVVCSSLRSRACCRRLRASPRDVPESASSGAHGKGRNLGRLHAARSFRFEHVSRAPDRAKRMMTMQAFVVEGFENLLR